MRTILSINTYNYLLPPGVSLADAATAVAVLAGASTLSRCYTKGGPRFRCSDCGNPVVVELTCADQVDIGLDESAAD